MGVEGADEAEGFLFFFSFVNLPGSVREKGREGEG